MSRPRPTPLGEPPLALWAAEADLSVRAGVAVTGSWAPTITPVGTWWGLRVRLALMGAQPTDGVPTTSDWVVAVDPGSEAVRVYPASVGDIVTATFGHQDFNGRAEPAWGVRSGYLCTASSTHKLATARAAEYDEPADLYTRVLWHVDRALDWLRDAAKDRLHKNGEPFELPDYKTRGRQTGTLAVYEDAASLESWWDAPRVGLAEVVRIGDRSHGADAVRGWRDLDGRDVVRPPWGTYVGALDGRQRAAWLRLNALPVVGPWQAPASGPELLDAARAQGLDPRELLAPVWRHLRGLADALLLVGAPIPARFGEGVSTMHWQALRLPTLGREKPRTRAVRDGKDFARVLGHAQALDWVPTTENWHPDVIGSRGQLRRELCEMTVVLIGVGALGSIVADALVRMGVRLLVVVDHDRYEAGNGVRHRLTLGEVGALKAPALAAQLNASNPSACVRGFAVSLPSDAAEVRTALAEADLVVDCTASDALLADLSALELRADARVVSGSVGLGADRLYMFSDRADRFTKRAFDAWFGLHRRQEHEAAAALGLPQAAGCWHPVTPVPYHRLLRQAGRFVERMDELVVIPASRAAEVHALDGLPRLRAAA